MTLLSLLSLVLAVGTYAQSTPYVDSNTGISFQRYVDTTGFAFGVAAPEDPTGDFIGQIVAPINASTGYGAVSLGGGMANSLLVVAWPNADSVMASFREATGYAAPGVYSGASTSLAPIANGTFVNTTHMTYTFLCSGCISVDVSINHFLSNASTIVVGWALGSSSPSNPSSASSATFVYHDVGFGEFGMNLTTARSAEYATWASWASSSTGNGTTPSAGSSTCSSTGTNTTSTVSNSTYDYIIAGGGPAGIIVAERLAESGKSVLLIERGQASNYASGGRSTVAWNDTVTQYDVPSMSYYLTTASDTSEYCTDTASMAGCLLGGGTMVNALMFVRPQEIDFNDKWPAGWKWSDVSASADKLYERNPGTTLPSKDGQRYDQAAFSTLSSFFSGIGFNEVDAIKEPNQKTKVFSYPPWSIADGLRASPLTSYYPLAQAMADFKLSLNTKVIRAVRTGSTITGVEVETSIGARQIINLNTNGKVILASGAMSTPRILFNSGIGPAAQITTVKNGCSAVTLPDQANWIDLPVGKNLKDHPIFTLTFNTKSNGANSTSLLAADFTSPSQTNIDLFAQGNGPLVQSGQRLVFWSSLETTNGTRYFQGTCNSPAAGQMRMKVYLTHGATSSGVLGITSQGATEFTTQPLMNTDEDKAAVVTFLDSIINAAKNSTVLSLNDSTMSGASIVSNYVTGDHFVGTTIMGTANDGSAVVDTDTKVFGTDNLFVVDASIHPDLPTGNTQAIVMVVAEHAASKILALSASTNSTAPITPNTNNSTVVIAPFNATTSSTAPISSATGEFSSSTADENDYD